MIKIKVLDEKCRPIRGTKDSAGIDLKAKISEPIKLKSMERCCIPVGIAVEIPIGYVGDVRPRSGLARDHGVVTTYGTIDSDYRGEIFVNLINLSKESYEIKPYERVAQLVVVKLDDNIIEFVGELSDTDRGTGGFGHTGKF